MSQNVLLARLSSAQYEQLLAVNSLYGDPNSVIVCISNF